ncbi:ribosomal RNA-processing protein 17 [Magnolia sinica]|uniref:ribosomal RNA-processing protein 17 n=1 Tax=Magnolia sinica TaxID=86752 RepID=UPI002657D2EE|nr:ribosomal RNA-processing protein 17 [Magnolia sinica]
MGSNKAQLADSTYEAFCASEVSDRGVRMEAGEEEGAPNPRVGARHIKKRALRNKALSISFNDKDLRDYVTGFHKRKKKRRKEAKQQLQEKERLKRIEKRKKRKMEREFALYGGAVPVENPSGAGSGPDECGSEPEEDGAGPTASVSGTKMYDNGDMTITVTTSELGCEDEDVKVTHSLPKSIEGAEKKHSLPVKKKPFKKAMKHRPHKKPKKSELKMKGKKKGRNKR